MGEYVATVKTKMGLESALNVFAGPTLVGLPHTVDFVWFKACAPQTVSEPGKCILAECPACNDRWQQDGVV